MQEKDMNKMKKRTFIIQEVNSNVQKKTKIMRSRFTRCVRLAIFIFEISIISQKQETKKKNKRQVLFRIFSLISQISQVPMNLKKKKKKKQITKKIDQKKTEEGEEEEFQPSRAELSEQNFEFAH